MDTWEEQYESLLDILHCLSETHRGVLVKAGSGYGVGCSDWTGPMIYAAAYDLLLEHRLLFNREGN